MSTIPSQQLAPAIRFSGKTARAFDIVDRAFELEETGADIIHLSVGDPDFDTPEAIIESAVSSLRNSRTHYSPVPGEPALRQAIADHAGAMYGQTIEPAQVIVFPGAQNALFATMACLAEAGDEVIIMEPAYTTYDSVAAAGGAKPVRVPLSAETGFQIDLARVEAAITDRTRAILINSPGNPTGTVYNTSSLAGLVALCKQRGIWLISDEVYSAYVFEGKHNSPLAQPGGLDTTFVINSLSKSHCMTGWRLGWVIAPLPVSHQLADLAQCMLFGVSQFIQDAAVTALTADLPELKQFHQIFQERRDNLYTGLQRIPGLKVHKPAGGMFLFVDVSAVGLDGNTFAERLLDEAAVSVVPGFGFGASLQHFVRIGYLCDTEVLNAAVQRIARFVASIQDRPKPAS